MSTWMINGPGQAFYVGNGGPASQFNPTGQVSPGSNYIPDEVAKQLVKEAGLRKSDTVPKRVIIGYLESMGLSAGLAPDVAMVLRNVYGVTPTFDESTDVSNAPLLAELRGALNESYPAPFRMDEPEILNEVHALIASEYAESSDADYDVVLECLSSMEAHDVIDIVEFYEWVGAKGFAYLADLVENGPDGLAEEVLEGICYPNSVISEDVQYHLDEMGIPDIKPLPKDQQDALRKKREAGMKKQREKVPSYRTQMKKAAKDRSGGQAEDPLAQRKAAAQRTGVSAMKSMSKAERGARLGALKDRAQQRWDKKTGDAAKAGEAEAQANKLQRKADSRAAMKDKGEKALGFMKKVGGAIKKGAGMVAKGAAKAVTAPVGGALKGAGYVAGRAAGGAVKGFQKSMSGASDKADSPSAPASAQSSARSSSGGSSKSEPKEKEGLATRIAKGIGRFAKNVVAGYKGDTPGIQSQMKGDKESGGEKKKAPGATKPSMAGESVADVMEAIAPSDISGKAVCEAMSELSWDDIAHVANIALLPIEESFALLSAFKTDADEFVSEWMGLVSGGYLPEGVTPESFTVLRALSLDEGVVPILVGTAVRAIQHAPRDVAVYIEGSYPELGRTVYGPAGDPKEGPETAKSYMSPYPAGVDKPTKGHELMTTRMFSDPDAREKERAERLADVIQVLGNMRDSAEDAGVNPEGMFLNVYRDLHREKARYS